MKMRWANAEDASALARVHLESWRSAYRGIVPESAIEAYTLEKREDRFRKGLAERPEQTAVIEVEGEVVGFVTFGACRDDDVEPERTGEIWGIYLAPDHWHKGYGTQATAWTLAKFTERGCREVVLWVLEANDLARRFYEARGFAPDGATKELTIGTALTAVRYRKVIGA